MLKEKDSYKQNLMQPLFNRIVACAKESDNNSIMASELLMFAQDWIESPDFLNRMTTMIECSLGIAVINNDSQDDDSVFW